MVSILRFFFFSSSSSLGWIEPTAVPIGKADDTDGWIAQLPHNARSRTHPAVDVNKREAT